MNFEGNIWGAIIALAMVINTALGLWGIKIGKDTHKTINSQLTAERLARNEQERKLVETESRAARAEGVLEGTGIVTTAKET